MSTNNLTSFMVSRIPIIIIIPDSVSLTLSPFVPVIHYFRQVFKTTSCVRTVVGKFLLVGQQWNDRVQESISEGHLQRIYT